MHGQPPPNTIVNTPVYAPLTASYFRRDLDATKEKESTSSRTRRNQTKKNDKSLSYRLQNTTTVVEVAANMQTTNFADFEPSAASPQAPETPPRPPPRDVNPFGEPESPPHAAPDNGVVNLGDTLDNAPPRPTTPPPPPPVPPKDAAIDGTDSGSSASPWVPSGAPEGGPHASPPSPPMSPLPPQSAPPPPPAVGRGGGGVGEALEEGAGSLLMGRRKGEIYDTI